MNKIIVSVLLLQSFYFLTTDAQVGTGFCQTRGCNSGRFRNTDGLCNNVNRPWTGARNTAFKRLLPPLYDDNNSQLKSKASNGTLPHPRDVSLNVHFPLEADGPLSLFGVIYGQMITHDIAQSSSATNNGTPVDCSANSTNPICINIPTLPRDKVNQDQPWIEVTRTGGVFQDTDCNPSARQQVSTATHWLDCSVIYGSSANVAGSLRTGMDGLLATSTILNKEFLPRQNAGGCVRETSSQTCARSGDSRPNENLVLQGIQTLFLREHNRIARIFKARRGGVVDETIFQETKRLVIAEYQNIFYNEWLPLIIGPALYASHNLKPVATSNSLFFFFGLSSNYNSSIPVHIYNELAAAALRFGHSLLKSTYPKKDRNYNLIRNLDLNDITFNPTHAFQEDGTDALVRGALTETCSAYDPHITNTPENHLFDVLEDPKAIAKRSSLSSLSVQRGRDHAFQPYWKYRQLFGLSVPKTWDDLDDIPQETVELLKKTYASVLDLELYTGGLSEIPVRGGVVGPLFAAIIARQFNELKFGDRLYFEWSMSFFELPQIKNSNMARIICDNLDVQQVPKNPFLPVGPSNPLVDCSTVPFVDLSRVI